jgi:hypothetical protein
VFPRGSSYLPTVEESKKEWEKWDLTSLPEVKNPQLLFEAVRDARYLKDTVRDSFLRRSSWLYPQDGCWIRAELARKQALQNKLGNLLKVFIFGALSVKTANALAGHVTWWYHVAPIFKDPSGKVPAPDTALRSR